MAETVGFTDDVVDEEANPFDDIDSNVETEEEFLKSGADLGYDTLNDGGDDIGTDDSDDEIMVVAEKITPKTKMKLMHKQQKRLGMPPGSGRGGRGGRGAVRGRGRPPSAVVTPKKAATVAKVSDGFEDEDDLTCRVCLSSFWYRNQLVEHLRNTHSVKDPETFLRERRSRV